MTEITYDYRAANGDLLYQEVRRPGKQFFLRRPAGAGGWINNLDGVPRVLYRLPELLASTEPIVWVEGPKDVETLRALGFVATTCAGGAAGWRDDFAESFRGRCLYALRDNDQPGLTLRERVVHASLALARCVHRVELPDLAEKEDVSDWLAKGHTSEELTALLADAPAAGTTAAAPAASAAGGVEPREIAPTVAHGESAQALPPFPEVAWVGPFAEYRALVGPTTEAPDSFHWAVLFQSLALMIGRGRWLSTPHPLYPNSYILIVAPTADVRKSTALDYGREVWGVLGVSVEVVTGLASAEGLYERLAKAPDTRALIFEDEFHSLLAAAARLGTRNLLPQLCSLYRCPERAQLTRRAGLSVERPFVSLISATTPTSIQSGLEEQVITGGFLNRCITITGQAKPWLPRPEPPAPAAFDAFVAQFRPLSDALRTSARRVHLTDAAGDLWDEWYFAWRRRRGRYSETEQALTARTQDHARKIALVYACVLAHAAIDVDDLSIGIAIAEHCETLTLSQLTPLITPRATQLEQRILKLTPAGGISRRQLQQLVGGRHTREAFAKALAILEESADIKIDAPDATSGRRSQTIRRLEEGE